MRVSNYIIYVPLNNDKNEYAIFHGFSGAIDIITEDIYEALKSSEDNIENITKLSAENQKILNERGYLTTLDRSQEMELFDRVAGKIDEIRKKKAFTVSLVPTYGCNFRCSYCYAGKVLDRVDENFNRIMSKEMVDRVIRCIDLKRKDGRNIGGIGLCGGEPLLKESFETIEYLVEKCLENGLRLSAITNGHDLNHYRSLLGKGKIEALQITIDGLEEYHNNRRFLIGKKPTFKKIIDNIDLCLESDVRVSVRTNIDESNLNQIEGLLKFFNDKGWNENKNFSHYFKGVCSCLDEEQKDSYIDDIKLMSMIGKEKLYKNKYNYNNMYSYIKKILTDSFTSNRYPTINSSHCSLPSNGVVVDPQGVLYPCIEVIGKEGYSIGSLNEDGTLEYNENVKLWRNNSVNNIKRCESCSYALYCGGGCPVQAMKETKFSNCSIFKNIFNELVPHVYEEHLQSEKTKVSNL